MVDSDFELEMGQMVGEYRVERKIGEGAFGKVYAALQPVIGKSVAIKVLNPSLSANKEMVTRFADEARAVNQIRHRNIIDIFSFGTLPNGVSYFVMELLEGMTFQQYLRKTGPLDPATALSLLWPIGRALGAAHKAGIAHRDLKPENVFLVIDEDGTPFPKLLDFGIAKLMSDQERSHRTQTGMLLGTPVYMSPEQCRALQIDHRADIYSFGIMTHEVITGRRPFDAPNVMDVIMKQISDPPPRMSACRPGLPIALDAPVLHMLEKAAARRPQTMQAALDELAEAARSVGISAPVSGRDAALSSVPLMSAASPNAPTVPVGPAASLGAAAQSLDTGAWLQNQGGPATGGASPAMSAAVPAMSAAVPAMSAAVPQMSIGGPQMSMGGPQMSMGAPQTSMGAPQLSMGAPQMSMGVPQMSMGAPQMSMGGPQASSSMAVPSLAVASGAVPMTPSMAQGMPQGDTSTLLSQGMGAPGHSASHPGNAPASYQPGYGPPPSYAQAPPAAKSKLPLVLGLGGGALVLAALSVGFALTRGGDSGSSGSGARPGGSASTAVQIGGEPPKVGRTLEQELDTVLSIDITGCTNGRSASEEVRQHRQYTVTTTAVNDWNATQGDIRYGESYTQTREGKSPAQSKPDPVAGKAFAASSQSGAFSVTSADGSAITPEITHTVKSDIGDMFSPRPEIFKHPLSRGDAVTLPPALAAALLGMSNDDPDTTQRVDNAVIRLTAIDRGQKRVTFDTDFTFVEEEKKSNVSLSGPIKGTLTLDIPTGRPVAGRLSGPLQGTMNAGGIRCNMKGLLTFDVKASVGN